MADELNASDGASQESGDQGGDDGDGGEGGAQDYAGFETPEELVEAHTGLASERDALQTRVGELDSLRGTQGNQIGQLNTQIATLTGQIEGLKAAAPAEAGPTMDQIVQQVEAGEITEGEGIRLATQLANTSAEEKFGKLLKDELGTLRQENENERQVAKFLEDNPGYVEAFKTGKLEPWLSQGIGGEIAWDKYQLQAKDTELVDLKNAAKENAAAAEESGLNKGIQLEKGKVAAGKVLTGKGGKFAQVAKNYDLNNPNQRRSAGIDVLKKMRGG